jgi:hypothetical protein
MGRLPMDWSIAFRRFAGMPWVLLFALPMFAWALPKSGSTVGRVSVVDTTGTSRTLPDAHRPILLMYEDRASASENQEVRRLLGRYTRVAENRAVFEFVAVADVSKWNWWPAKRHVLEELRAEERRHHTTLYADWNGSVRRSWGFQKSRSTVLLLGQNGSVRFSAEGPLSAEKRAALEVALRQLGAHPEDEAAR